MMRLILLITVLFVYSGCSLNNSDGDDTTLRSIRLVKLDVKQNSEITYNLGGFGDEENAVIKQQAEKAELSELVYDYEGAVVIKYRYRPKSGVTGEDWVVVEIRRGSDGESGNRNLEYILFELTVI